MCLIMVGKTADILKMDLKSAWRCNSDGAGLVIAEKKPIVVKGLMSLKSLLACLKKIPDNREIAVHLRMATHGRVCKENTHPFQVDQYSTMMHNGILSSLGKSGVWGESDSAHLARILTKVKHQDRLALLKTISGKYLYTHQTSMFAIGDFTLEKGVKLSNTYWKSGGHQSYINLDEYLAERELRGSSPWSGKRGWDTPTATSSHIKDEDYKHKGYARRYINGIWVDEEPENTDVN